MTASSALSFSDVSVRFPDGTVALDNVSLHVAKGEFVAIVGPSGCGKSTVLRVASGLQPQTSGSHHHDESGLGYVFQDPTLLPWRSVESNVALFAELEGLGRTETRSRVQDALGTVGLLGWEQKFPHQLSGGMRMRVSLARSLVLRPGLFLFDEPFGALDEITRERLNDELMALFTEHRFTSLLVTHSVAEAVFLASRVIVMSPRPGRVLADISVPFGYPREHDLRYSAEFGALAARVSSELREGAR